ncbi:sodium-dependent proline transporter-like isoform X7 [Accipiter gentilis]|uniref:sodium-dependent proline transporter-like isoform X7 n=1 Tax=Astur gentilis TaxID=8957 RepID=UPI00210F5B59|nr:sodium-dependent proline transporter-like isoform X7 [Accipiter gentilis]
MPGTGHLDMPGPPAPATPPEPTVNILQMEGPTTDPTCQPWPGPPPQPDIPAPSSRRVTWTGKYKFLLSCVGYCVGLGNIWRFPYLCYRNGGGVFLIPYFIMSLIMGLPLFLMELSLGQYGAAGPITIWNCCPLLKGIGIAMLITSSLVSLYYNVIIAWAFYYLGSSFQSPLPWSCDAPGNAYLCQNASGIVSWVSASEVFWNEQVLGVMHSSGLGDPGAVQWPLALCLLAAWIIVFFCTLKGIHSSGKVRGSVWGLQGGLLCRWSGAELSRDLHRWCTSRPPFPTWSSSPSSSGGPRWTAPSTVSASTSPWTGAGCRVPRCGVTRPHRSSIPCASGLGDWSPWLPTMSLTTTSSRTPWSSPLGTAAPASLLALPSSRCWGTWPGGTKSLWAVSPTQFGNIKGITRAILDEFPALDNQRKKAALLGALCTSFYLLGLPLVTQGGIFWFTLIDKYSTGFGLITISLFMCLGITFCYGVNQFCQDIMDMIRQYPPWCKHMLGYFKACWAFFTPCLLLFVLVCTCLDMHHMPLHHGTYEYPTWGTNLGICMGILTCLQVPLWAIMALCRESGTLRNRFQKAIQPLHSWRAAAGRNMDGVVIVWHSPSP